MGSPPGASHRIVTNTLYLLAADVANKLLSLGFFILAARHLGVEIFGSLSYAVAYVTTIGVLADLGLAVYITREVARRPGDADVLVGQAIIIRGIAGVVIGALVAASAFVFANPTGARSLVAICSTLVLANGLFTLVAGVYQGYERNVYTALTRLIQTGLLVTGAVVLLRFPPSAESFAWVMVGAASLSAAASIVWMSRRLVRPALRFRTRAIVSTIRAALPMGISAILVTVYYWNGSALLVSLAGQRAAGVFAAPHRLVLGMAVLGMAFSGAMYPHMARLHSREQEHLVAVLAKALRYVSLTAVPLALLGSVLAGEVVGLIYGGAYNDSVPVFRVLALWGCGTYYNSLLSNYYYSVHRARFATIQAAISLVVNVVGNLLLIPRFGALGAAVSLAAAEFVGMAWLLSGVISALRPVHGRRLLAGLLKCMVGALVAAGVGKFAGLLNGVAALVAAAVGYCLMVVLLKVIGSADFEVIKRVLLRRRPAESSHG